MAIRLSLRRGQLEDLHAILKLGPRVLESVVQHVHDRPGPLLSPEDLRSALNEALPERRDDAEVVFRQMLSLYALRRQRRLSAEQVVEGLRHGITHAPKDARWSSEDIEDWEKLEPQIEGFLSMDEIVVLAKAIDLAYEYANLFQSARIITDIRPLFNIGGDEMEATVVSFTLRLYYDTRESDHSLSIALDEADVRQLGAECDRALVKAETARKRMEREKLPTVVSGRDRNDAA